MVRTPDGQKRKIAALDTSWPELVYSPSGHILYRRGRAGKTVDLGAARCRRRHSRSNGEPFLVERTGLGMSVATEGTFVYLDFGRDRGQFIRLARIAAGAFLAQATGRTRHDSDTSHSHLTGIELSSNAVDGGRQSLWLYDAGALREDATRPGNARPKANVCWEVTGSADNHVYYTLLTPPSAYQLWADARRRIRCERARCRFQRDSRSPPIARRDGRYLVVSLCRLPAKPAGIWLLRLIDAARRAR